jgi:hypothetical protein
MSFIDIYGHEYVASFAGYPVYHPLEPIKGEFEAGPDTLLLGGGSGEHPALIVRNLEYVAALYIDELLEEACDPGSPDDFIERSKILSEPCTPYECLEFAHWNVEDYARFFERCCAPTLDYPYDKAEYHYLERWLALNFGKLLCHSLPDLVPALESDLKEAWDFSEKYASNLSNFVCNPPGLPTPGGRRIHGRLGEGLLAWESVRRADT